MVYRLVVDRRKTSGSISTRPVVGSAKPCSGDGSTGTVPRMGGTYQSSLWFMEVTSRELSSRATRFSRKCLGGKLATMASVACGAVLCDMGFLRRAWQ